MKVSTDACLFGAWVAADAGDALHVLDIGAGTGLLMLMVAQKNMAALDGIEIEPDCFVQLKENAEASVWRDRMTLIEGDAREHIFKLKYDLILSNPPFYEQQLKGPGSSRNKAMHSTELRLKELFDVVVSNLDPRGKFAILLPHFREAEAISDAKERGLHVIKMVRVRHSRDHPWYRAMILFGWMESEVIKQEITIHDAVGSYGKEFTVLLQDYYLTL